MPSDNLRITLSWKGIVTEGLVTICRTGDKQFDNYTRGIIGETAKRCADDMERQLAARESC